MCRAVAHGFTSMLDLVHNRLEQVAIGLQFYARRYDLDTVVHRPS